MSFDSKHCLKCSNFFEPKTLVSLSCKSALTSKEIDNQPYNKAPFIDSPRQHVIIRPFMYHKSVERIENNHNFVIVAAATTARC